MSGSQAICGAQRRCQLVAMVMHARTGPHVCLYHCLHSILMPPWALLMHPMLVPPRVIAVHSTQVHTFVSARGVDLIQFKKSPGFMPTGVCGMAQPTAGLGQGKMEPGRRQQQQVHAAVQSTKDTAQFTTERSEFGTGIIWNGEIQHNKIAPNFAMVFEDQKPEITASIQMSGTNSNYLATK